MKTTDKTSVIIVGLITAVCLLGDTMLFIVLPIYYQEFGLTSLWQVGVLLSINRLIRLPINPLVGWFYSRMSYRSGILLAVVLVVLTTFSYGWLQGFWLLLLIRCVWGIAWSFIRLGGYLTVIHAGSEKNRGQLIGLYNGLFGLGGLIGMFVGGLMADLISIQAVTNTFSLIALLTIPFVIKLIPATTSHSQEKPISNMGNKHESFWKKPNFIVVMCSGFIIQMVIMGVFASTLSKMISVQLSTTIVIFGIGIGAATFAGVIQAIRWSWDPFLAPFVGGYSDRMRKRKTLFILSILGGALFFALIPFGGSIMSLTIFLLCFQLMSTLMIVLNDSIASDFAANSSKVKVMTAYTMMIDTGSAIGPLLGYLMIEWLGIYSLYWFISGLLCVLGFYLSFQLRD